MCSCAFGFGFAFAFALGVFNYTIRCRNGINTSFIRITYECVKRRRRKKNYCVLRLY